MDWNRLLREATDEFAATLEHGDLDARVPSCPGWRLADLGEHLRSVHTWAAHAVTEGNPKGTPPPGDLERDALVAGYRTAARHLIAVLEEAGPDGPAWTFGPEPVAGFWQRRQVHETTMHVYDARLALGREAAWTIAPELAWDGVDEVATVFYPRQLRLGRTEPLPGTLRLTATDTGATIEIGDADPVHDVTGTAAELLLTLWKRRAVADPAAAELLAAAITP